MLKGEVVVAITQANLSQCERTEAVRRIKEIAVELEQDQNDVAFRDLLAVFAGAKRGPALLPGRGRSG